MVKFLRFARKNRATFIRIVADRDHVIEIYIQVFIDVVGSMLADVDAIFTHRGDGAGVNAVGFHPGAVHRYFARVSKMGQIPVSDLAAAGIASTEDKDVFVIHLGGCKWLTVTVEIMNSQSKQSLKLSFDGLPLLYIEAIIHVQTIDFSLDQTCIF